MNIEVGKIIACKSPNGYYRVTKVYELRGVAVVDLVTRNKNVLFPLKFSAIPVYICRNLTFIEKWIIK